MEKRVDKYGGTSMAYPQDVLRKIELNDPVVAVVSAPGVDIAGDTVSKVVTKMTDMLLDGNTDDALIRAEQIVARSGISAQQGSAALDNFCGWISRYQDDPIGLSAGGEFLSATIIAMATGRILLDPLTLVAIDKKSSPNVPKSVHSIKARLNLECRYVLPGFYGYSEVGTQRIQTMERDGSSITGAMTALALGAEYRNYSDVDGFYTANPNTISTARHIPAITFDQIRALAFGGSKLLHPTVSYILKQADLPMLVANTFSDAVGTVISNTEDKPNGRLIATASRPVSILDMCKSGIDETVSGIHLAYDILAENNIPYLLSFGGPDETTIVIADGIDSLSDTMRSKINIATGTDVEVSPAGLVLAVLSSGNSYVASQHQVASVVMDIDPSATVIGSLQQGSVTVITNVHLRHAVEIALHNLIEHY